MKLSSLKRAVSSRLAVRLILAVIALLSAVSLILTLFFMYRQKSLLTEEVLKRTRSLAHNFAYNIGDIVILHDLSRLQTLVQGVDREPDIESTLVTDIEGSILANTDKVTAGETFNIPDNARQSKNETWISAGNGSKQRLIVPIIKDFPLIHSNSNNLGVTNISNIWEQIYRMGGYQPNFNQNSENILYTFYGVFSLTAHGSRDFGMLSINVRDRTNRLVLDNASNGYWSNTGRYIVYNNIEPPLTISVYDTVTGTKHFIAKDETNARVVSCFTPDDRYIITSLGVVGGEQKLFRINIESGKPEQLTFQPGNHGFPNCSSDGNWIVYTDLYNHRTCVYNVLTKKSSRLFPDEEECTEAASFSPDGKQICYLREVDAARNEWDVFITAFPVDYTKPVIEWYGRRLTNTGNLKLYTDWSPDGSMITYCQRTLSHPFFHVYEVWVVSAKGDSPPVNLMSAVETFQKRVGYVVLDVSMINVQKMIMRGNYLAIMISLLLTGIGILCAVVMVRNIVRPVKTLADAAGKVAEGYLDLQVAVSRDDEIGALAESFNRMTGRLKDSVQKIETRSHDLEKAYHDLESLDRAKDEFLSLASHELRSPLGSILLHAEMLLKKQVDTEEKQTHFFETIVNQCERLTRLVNDILDLSKIEAGRMEIHVQPFSLRKLLSDVYSALSTSIQKKNLRFDYAAVPGRIWLNGDRDKIAEVLTNIITNSIKFTPEGGNISVSLSVEGDTGTIAVRDTGIGIPEEDIPKVFDRFRQLEKVEHHAEGSGLGMTISKSLVELHGGRIWIESTEGTGTAVFFTLPLSDRPQEPEEHTKESTLPKAVLQITDNTARDSAMLLIVDDEQTYREAIAYCVRRAGYDTIEASSGNEALRLTIERRPDLIILDVMMPDLSGLDVCRILREKPETKDIPVIMLSARGQVKEKEEGLHAGADRYITKPFNNESLMLTIGELLGGDE